MSKIYHVSDTECINLDYCVQVSVSATNTVGHFEVIITFADGHCKGIPVRSFEEGKTIYNDIVNVLEDKALNDVEEIEEDTDKIEFYLEDRL